MDVDKPKKLCISQTLRDKELERIKSLGVVSVLNKNFNEAAPGPPRPASLLPALSPSNSLRTDNPSSDTSTKSRSRSVSRSQAASFSSNSKPASSSSLYNDYSSTMSRTSSSNAHKLNKSLTSSSGHEDSDDQQFEPERKTDQEESLVVDSPIDTEKEILLKRVQELEALYNASIIDLQVLESRNNSQKDILIMQDKLIQQMTNELDAQEINSMQPCQICSLDNSNFDCILKAQQDVAILTRELHEMGPLTSEYNSTISDLNEELTKHDQRIEELEHVAREIQKANATQTEFIDTKVQTLLDRILAKNAIINKLEHDQQQQLLHQQLPPTPKPEMIHQSNSITSLTDSSTLAYEQKVQIEQDEIGTAQESPNGQTMHISRWKGNPIPPASPPPSLPLPPIPSVSSRSISTIRRNSILSEITKRSSIYAQHTSSKHISADAGGELGERRSLTRSDFDEELAEAAYYKEFTTQLQERLSVSKEIDDLRVWAPSDYDNIQRKISSKNWSDSDDELSLSSQKTAFWKGMKKKLRV
ncbi:hypothetical protein [Parasitella parasitica]|uniref:Uncharacterized protein n=1 Tax=Parasitella parasitica TaxID=35722 RepID=A0A0B7N3S9_9FUNG|nr:hypothetical protein [Parasitella parasitica]